VKRKLLVAISILVLTLFVGVWATGTMLSDPAQRFIGDAPQDLAAEAVQFRSESGSTIRGWFVAGKKDGGAVILMHGVRASRVSMLGRARFLSRAGFSVLLFDFQALEIIPLALSMRVG
jgi:hypothetical protein